MYTARFVILWARDMKAVFVAKIGVIISFQIFKEEVVKAAIVF